MSSREIINPILIQQIERLMELSAVEKWEEVDAGIPGLEDFSASDTAHYLLDKDYLSEQKEPDGNKRDCAFTILSHLPSYSITGKDKTRIVVGAAVATTNDSHPFAAGRAANLLRIWRKDPDIGIDVEQTLRNFARRADKKRFGETQKSWLEQYKDDISGLYSYLMSSSLSQRGKAR